MRGIRRESLRLTERRGEAADQRREPLAQRVDLGAGHGLGDESGVRRVRSHAFDRVPESLQRQDRDAGRATTGPRRDGDHGNECEHERDAVRHVALAQHREGRLHLESKRAVRPDAAPRAPECRHGAAPDHAVRRPRHARHGFTLSGDRHADPEHREFALRVADFAVLVRDVARTLVDLERERAQRVVQTPILVRDPEPPPEHPADERDDQRAREGRRSRRSRDATAKRRHAWHLIPRGRSHRPGPCGSSLRRASCESSPR